MEQEKKNIFLAAKAYF